MVCVGGWGGVNDRLNLVQPNCRVGITMVVYSFRENLYLLSRKCDDATKYSISLRSHFCETTFVHNPSFWSASSLKSNSGGIEQYLTQWPRIVVANNNSNRKISRITVEPA